MIKILAIICAVISAIILLLIVFSRIVYHRSIIATIVEWYLRLTERHYTEEELKSSFKEINEKGDIPYEIPRKIEKRLDFEEIEYDGMQVFYINKNLKSEKAVIYLHGGAYYRKPRKYHIRFIERVSNETDTPFIVPIYKKAPNHCCEEAYKTLKDFYLEIKSRYKKIILIGDSSGGGLALGLTLYLIKEGIEIPNCLTLLSPWVDVALENSEIEKYIKKDPIVFLDNVKLLGREWARDLPLYDYRVSPVNGEMNGLCTTHIFCGTRELLYPDCLLLYEKIKSCGVNVRFYKGEGMNHVYPIFPIPEAKKARKLIDGIIDET